MTELAASNDFQTAVQNYLDLEDLRRKLASWDVDFDSFDDMIGLRRSYYEPLLPGVDHDFRDADSRMRLRIEQHKLLEQRLRGLLVAPRPDFLATADERLVSEQLSSLDRALGGAEGQQADALRERIRRLQGVITFQLRTQYDDRLAKFNRHLAELSAAIDVLNARYESFVRARQAAVHSYEGYDTPIARLRTHVSGSLAKVNQLLARQGHIIELVAIDVLTARRERLAQYQDQARYALADSYDRATKSRVEGKTAALAPTGEARVRAYVQLRLPMALAMAALAGCASAPARHTLGDLRTVKPDVAEVDVQDSLDLAMSSYRRFLEETETGAMTPEAMRRLADLQLEKEYGIAGGSPQALPAPRQGFAPAAVRDTSLDAPAGAVAAAHESDEEFERRATQQQDLVSAPARGSRLARRREPAAQRSARGDRDLQTPARRIPELRAQRPSHLSNGARVRRARADRAGDGGDATARRRVRLLEVQRRGELQTCRILLHEIEVPRRRASVSSDHVDGGAIGVLRARALQARLDALQARLLRGRAASVHGAPRLQAVDRLRLRSAPRGRGRAPRRGHVPRDQPELLEPRRRRGVARVLRVLRSARVRGPHLQESRRVLPREASLSGRGDRVRVVREAPSAASRVAALQHARDRDLPAGRLPQARRGVEEGLRSRLRVASRVLAAFRRQRIARSA